MKAAISGNVFLPAARLGTFGRGLIADRAGTDQTDLHDAHN